MEKDPCTAKKNHFWIQRGLCIQMPWYGILADRAHADGARRKAGGHAVHSSLGIAWVLQGNLAAAHEANQALDQGAPSQVVESVCYVKSSRVESSRVYE